MLTPPSREGDDVRPLRRAVAVQVVEKVGQVVLSPLFSCRRPEGLVVRGEQTIVDVGFLANFFSFVREEEGTGVAGHVFHRFDDRTELFDCEYQVPHGPLLLAIERVPVSIETQVPSHTRGIQQVFVHIALQRGLRKYEALQLRDQWTIEFEENGKVRCRESVLAYSVKNDRDVSLR